MKRILNKIALILVTILMFTQVAFADTKPIKEFSDLDKTHWAYESIYKLVDAGIIEGYPDGTFNPEGKITRAELVKIVNMVFKYTDKQDTTSLTDIKTDDWFYNHVLIAEKAGYIVGFEDGTFRPSDNITREQLCKVIDVINGLVELPFDKTPADEVSPWAVDFVNRVLSNRIMALDENNYFRATEDATRAEVCDALANFVLVSQPEEGEEEVPSGGGGGGTGVPGEVTDEELIKTMNTVIRRLKEGVIPELSNSAQIEIVNDIISSMENYKKDNSFDYKAAADDTYEKYKKLSDADRKQLKDLIQLKNTTNDLYELKEFFFPDVEI